MLYKPIVRNVCFYNIICNNKETCLLYLTARTYVCVVKYNCIVIRGHIHTHTHTSCVRVHVPTPHNTIKSHLILMWCDCFVYDITHACLQPTRFRE